MVYVLFGIIFILFAMYLLAEDRNIKMVAAFKVYEGEVNKLVSNIDASYKQAELLGSAKERFKRFRELTESQQSLLGQVDRPSASASHSKFKNTIIRELKQIEDDKKEILKSVLDDGIDIHISMMDMNGKITKILISEFLNGQSPSPEKTDSINPQKVERNLRLVKSPLELVKEEKSDDTSGTKIH